MRKSLVMLVLVVMAQASVGWADYMLVKLSDEREELVRDAKFYWKHQFEDSYRQFDKVEEYQKLARLGNFSTQFNYRFGRSSNPKEVVDLKVVAPGYDVHTWSQVFPYSGPEIKVIILSRLKESHRQERGGSKEHASVNSSGRQERGSSKDHDGVAPAGVMKLDRDLVDGFYGTWWCSRWHGREAYRLTIDKKSKTVSMQLVTPKESTDYPVKDFKVLNDDAIAFTMPLIPAGGERFEFTFTYSNRDKTVNGSFKNNHSMKYTREKPFGF